MQYIRRKLRHLKRRHHRRPGSTAWPALFPRLRRTLRWGLRLALFLLAVDVFYLAHIWPDWNTLADGPPRKSAFIQNYEMRRAADNTLPPLNWQPISLHWISPAMRRAAIVAEDARFYQHQGFDLAAFQEAMDHNLENMELRYGASTISQQTVKNLFFSASRNPLRKWHELIFTLAMEHQLSKRRILEIYLNIAEFGIGVYGVEAAARHYWGIPAAMLSQRQAAALAACLPSPKKHNPVTRSRRHLERTRKILRYM